MRGLENYTHTHTKLKKMVTILLCVLSVWLPYINGVNVESLRAHSPIFGLSLLADGNTSVCRQEFSDLRDAVIQGKVWGLKGNFLAFK